MFDLNKSLAAWRRSLEHNRAFTQDDVDELEQHLRDQVFGLVEEGLSQKTAFRRALSEMGDYTSAEMEYRKVYWGKLKQRRHVLSELFWRFSMFKNYLTVAFRSMLRHKGFAFIHVFGLSIGLASCMLIGLYIHDEVRYDSFHEKADRVYRVLRQFDLPDLQTTIETTPTALAVVAEQLPDVERATRMAWSSPIVKRGTQEFVESGFLYTEAGFFELFSYPLSRGTAALDRPGTLVLSERMAAKYFADEDPVGQMLVVDDRDVEVTGVMSPTPAQSHLRFDFVGSIEIADDQLNWGFNNHLTYLLLREGAAKEGVTHQVAAVIAENRPEQIGGVNDFIPHLQPIRDIHLGEGVSVDITSRGNILYVYLFGALAVFVLLLACINFMNLATARSLDRAREVGMRKTLGAKRAQLVGQFLGESVLTSAVALALAFGLCFVLLPSLNDFTGKNLSFSMLFKGSLPLFIAGLVLGTGLIAGSYPALVLSHFKPIRALKGVVTGGRGDGLRKGLVIFQFALSIALIASTGVVLSQLSYMQSAGLGFEAEHLLTVEQAGYLGSKIQAFEEEASRITGVESVSSGFSMPGTFFINSMWQTDDPGSEAHNLDYTFVDFDYIETLGIEMVAGRSINPAYSTDSSAVMLNETAAFDFGWSADEAVGKKLRRGDSEFTVVGVAKDFHYRSLHETIYPLALFGPWRSSRYAAIRLSGENVPLTLASLKGVWQQFSELPFSYSFLADNLASQYRSEQVLSRVFIVFSGLAILIACLGLFGLVAFMAEKRTKEFGIRKTLGASTGNLLTLLSKDFLKLVMVAFLVAVPVGFVAMNRWLEQYAYRIEIDLRVFLLAGGLAFVIALGTVSFQSIKAAFANPVTSLRHE